MVSVILNEVKNLLKWFHLSCRVMMSVILNEVKNLKNTFIFSRLPMALPKKNHIFVHVSQYYACLWERESPTDVYS